MAMVAGKDTSEGCTNPKGRSTSVTVLAKTVYPFIF
jgi:hypothetical protein